MACGRCCKGVTHLAGGCVEDWYVHPTRSTCACVFTSLANDRICYPAGSIPDHSTSFKLT